MEVDCLAVSRRTNQVDADYMSVSSVNIEIFGSSHTLSIFSKSLHTSFHTRGSERLLPMQRCNPWNP